MIKKIYKLVTFVFAILLFIGAGLYIFITTKPPVERFQEIQSKGQIANLSKGNTYYEIAGPESGDPIILVHGSIVPSVAFDNNFNTLADSGYRVIRMDLYGRGLSSRPKITYTMDAYLDQIKELMDTLNVSKPTNLAGASMGGALIILFAEKYPQLVKKLILLDPVTPSSFSTRGSELVEKLKTRVTQFKDRIGNGNGDSDVAPIKLASDQFKYEGVGRSIFSAVANLKSLDLSSSYEKVAMQKKPTLLIWGTDDDVIPVSENETVRKFIPHTQYHQIDDAGHMPHYEQPNIVNPILLNFLKQ